MMSFRGTRLQNTKLPLSVVWLLETLAESKGRQQLYEKQSPQLLNSLNHDIMPWFAYLLSVFRRAYREFEDRAERQRPQRGSKTEMVEYSLESMVGQFGIADVERLCPSVSRDTIRLVMNRWREQGRLEMLGKGRDAKWRRKA